VRDLKRGERECLQIAHALEYASAISDAISDARALREAKFEESGLEGLNRRLILGIMSDAEALRVGYVVREYARVLEKFFSTVPDAEALLYGPRGTRG
jgi:hypothetical protein